MPRVDVRVPRSRRKGIQVINLTDFTGGLNLTPDQFRIAKNESPDLLNVDLGQRGGFTLRRVVSPLNRDALTFDPMSMWVYRNSIGTNQLMVNVVYDVLYSTGGEFTSVGLADAIGGPMRATTFDDVCYIQRNADQVAVTWDGATDGTLTASGTGAWQDDVAAPVGGHMPKAKLIASHGGYVWVANTVEDGTAYRNRVRWSHANRPEDWRENDYIDIEVGHDGDEIVALVPYSDHLLVFKTHSLYAIFGYDADSFQVVGVDQQRGTQHQDSVVATPMGVFFFHWPEGVYHYDGKKGGRWISEKIYPAVRDGDIPSAYREKIMLGYGRGRVWVSVPWEDSTNRARTFVYDPGLGKEGAWTLYDLPTGPYVEWVTSTDTHFVGGYVGSYRIVKLEQTGVTDDVGDVTDELEDDFSTDGPMAGRTPTGVSGGNWDTYALKDSVYNAALEPYTEGGYMKCDPAHYGAGYAWVATDTGEPADEIRVITRYTTGTTYGAAHGVIIGNDPLPLTGSETAIDIVTPSVHIVFMPVGYIVQLVDGNQDIENVGNVVVYGSPLSFPTPVDPDTDYEIIIRRDPGDPTRITIWGADGEPNEFEHPAFADVWGSVILLEPFHNEELTLDLTDVGLGVYVWPHATNMLPLFGNVTAHGHTPQSIDSHFQTAWFDDGQPAVRKRWKRAEAVLHHEGTQLSIPVKVYRDWDPINWVKEFDFTLDEIDGMLWDYSDWDDSDWYQEGEVNAIDRGANLGAGRAVSLRFDPPTDIQWGVEALVLKYLPRTIRS
jgi:hypothetical protein